jgi:hypothetical protein
VYHTCLYCNHDLGHNEVVELLPIGRRLAFDAAQGRLWVVCRSCEKWNLVPFDTRLETIDVCEALFRGARLRYSTDHIGIARLSEGLELVRIGSAQRPEFAAWRYGDQFGRRRRKNRLQYTLGTASVVALFVTRHALLPVIGMSGSMSLNMLSVGTGIYSTRRVAVRIPERDGVGGVLSGPNAAEADMVTGHADDWALRLRLHHGSRAGFVRGLATSEVRLTGAHAVEGLGLVLPLLNRAGGSQRVVGDAVAMVGGYGDIHGLVDGYRAQNSSAEVALRSMDRRVTLAFEMASHEETERVALGGELKLLERQWKEADELARIADDLAVTEDVVGQLGGRKV